MYTYQTNYILNNYKLYLIYIYLESNQIRFKNLYVVVLDLNSYFGIIQNPTIHYYPLAQDTLINHE
jgi:hypothetical protein